MASAMSLYPLTDLMHNTSFQDPFSSSSARSSIQLHSSVWSLESRGFLRPTWVADVRPSFVVLTALLLFLFVMPVLGSMTRYILGVRWLLSGPHMLAQGYCQWSTTYSVATPEHRLVVVSSEKQIRELSQFSENDFSLVEVAKEVFSPQHTMNGVEMTGLAMHRRLLRSMTLSLPSSTPMIQTLIREALTAEIDAPSSINLDGWTSFSSLDMAMRLMSRANARMFCGHELAEDEDFVKVALKYSNDVSLAAEATRLLPSWLKSSVAYLVTRGNASSKQVISSLRPVIQTRIQNHGTSLDYNDYLQGIINSVPEDTEDRVSKIISHLMALWFASIHQPAITLLFVLHDLCAHPEYIDMLRSEATAHADNVKQGKLSDLSLLDSFIKESTRMHAFETVSLRRKSMHNQRLSDGTAVHAGDWVCAPQAAIMNDPNIYEDPDHFNGFRFVKGHPAASYTGPAHRLTDVHPNFLFWGLGKQACPGRMYTSHVFKLSIIYLITNFDLESNSSVPETFIWRSMRVPLSSNRLFLRRRAN